MNERLLLYLISFGFAVAWSLMFYFFKQIDAKIKVLDIEVNNQKTEVELLKSKMWQDNKLKELVETTINNAFNIWENKMLKNGTLQLQK